MKKKRHIWSLYTPLKYTAWVLQSDMCSRIMGLSGTTWVSEDGCLFAGLRFQKLWREKCRSNFHYSYFFLMWFLGILVSYTRSKVHKNKKRVNSENRVFKFLMLLQNILENRQERITCFSQTKIFHIFLRKTMGQNYLLALLQTMLVCSQWPGFLAFCATFSTRRQKKVLKWSHTAITWNLEQICYKQW